MKRFLLAMHALLLVAILFAANEARANDAPWVGNGAAIEYSDYLFTAEELEDLLAPIALYPDPLLAQILPAATFIDQVDEAARFVRRYGRSPRVDYQPWDVSVRAVAHYPDVLFMMDRKYDWTVSLGQAYINQPDEVMDAVQRLREDARDMGNLVSTPQQTVIIDDGYIRIIPAEPAVIYVPAYDPQVVYVERPYRSYAFVSFGLGLTIGAWLNRDCDWRQHRVYYHGWRDGGWIARARPHIIDRRNVTVNNIYINSNYRTVTINRRVMQHDTVRFRNTIRQDVERRRTLPGRPVPLPREQRRGEVRVPAVRQTLPAPRQSAPVPAPAQLAPRPARPEVAPPAPAPRPAVQPAPRPEQRDSYRGREPRPGQPAPSVVYGGTGSSKDAKSYRERGRDSRERMQQPAQQPRAEQAPRVAPAPSQAPAGVKPAPQQPAARQTPPVRRGGEEKREIKEQREPRQQR